MDAMASFFAAAADGQITTEEAAQLSRVIEIYLKAMSMAHNFDY
jgi:hypothetical protein